MCVSGVYEPVVCVCSVCVMWVYVCVYVCDVDVCGAFVCVGVCTDCGCGGVSVLCGVRLCCVCMCGVVGVFAF